MIASLIHAGARLDRDENHVKNQKQLFFSKQIFGSFSQPSAFYEKLLYNLSIVITNQFRQLANYPNSSM